jgi:acyl-CoA reductase-like NAD-dependent aldehyde dehydrogenase
MRILLRAAQLIDDRSGDIARTITAENGKTINEATVEATRAGDPVRLSAFEGAHLYGETLPLDAHPGAGSDGSAGRRPGRRRRRARGPLRGLVQRREDEWSTCAWSDTE